MIICQCTGITDTDITQMVREGAQSADELMHRSGAGRCCEPCRAEIATVLYQALSRPRPAQPQPVAS